MNDVTPQVRIRKELYEKLKIKAEADNRSITNYIEKVLREHLEVSNG